MAVDSRYLYTGGRDAIAQCLLRLVLLRLSHMDFSWIVPVTRSCLPLGLQKPDTICSSPSARAVGLLSLLSSAIPSFYSHRASIKIRVGQLPQRGFFEIQGCVFLPSLWTPIATVARPLF